MLSSAAFNALLKTLEEPPAHIVFILATTEPQKLPETILSRCQRFDFGRIPITEICGRLKEAAEGSKANVSPGALMIGRDTLEMIYADLFHTEAALMRPHVSSGTAALSLTLFGLSRPGDKIVSATGMPYDTLQGVIGTGTDTPPGSLKEMGVEFECVELKNGMIDIPEY